MKAYTLEVQHPDGECRFVEVVQFEGDTYLNLAPIVSIRIEENEDGDVCVVGRDMDEALEALEEHPMIGLVFRKSLVQMP